MDWKIERKERTDDYDVGVGAVGAKAQVEISKKWIRKAEDHLGHLAMKQGSQCRDKKIGMRIKI